MGCTESCQAKSGAQSQTGKCTQVQLDITDGCCSQSQHDGTCSAYDLLTPDEREILKSDWERLSRGSQQEMGMRIFLRIFQLEASAKRSFAGFCDLEGEALTSNALFRCHATRFMRAVAATVDNIDALDIVVVPKLIQLGQLHSSVAGLSRRHLDAFEQAMAEVWADELLDQSTDCTRAWTESTSAPVWQKVFKLITTRIYEGYSLSTESNNATGDK